MVNKPRRRFKAAKGRKKARGKAKFTTSGKAGKATKTKGPRRYKYEDHAVERASLEFVPCDQKRKQKIVLKDYTDSKGVFHKADIDFRSTSLSSNGKVRKQTNWRMIEWDYVNRQLGVVIEIDGIGHYSSHVFGGSAFVAGRENDLIKEAYCKKNGWILVRVSNLSARDPTKCCGIPEFNKRLDRKFAKIRRMLGSRAPQKRRIPQLTTTRPPARKRVGLSTPLPPFAHRENISSVVEKMFLKLK